MFAQQQQGPQPLPPCSQTPCSVKTNAETTLSVVEASFFGASEQPHRLDLTSRESDSPSKPRLDFKSVRVFNRLLNFSFEFDDKRTRMAIRIPTFYSEPQNQSFFKVTSLASFNFVQNFKCDFGQITERDLRPNSHLIPISLRGLNNLQLRRRLKEERFDIFQKVDSKKIRKYFTRTRREQDRRQQTGPGLFAPATQASEADWRSFTPDQRVSQGSGVDRSLLTPGPHVGRIGEFDFSRVAPFEPQSVFGQGIPKNIFKEELNTEGWKTENSQRKTSALAVDSNQPAGPWRG